jgi:benzodiazapine receptor
VIWLHRELISPKLTKKKRRSGSATGVSPAGKEERKKMSAPFCSTDLVKAAFYAGFWYWQWSMQSMRGRRWYETYRVRIPFAPPGWLFGVMWATIFSLLGVSTYLYDRNFSAGTYHTAVLWLILGNALLNKLWSLLYFDRSQVLAALIVLALGILPTAVLIPIFMALDSAWVAFGLWLLYPLWLLVATYLNWNWFRRGFPTNDTQELPMTSTSGSPTAPSAAVSAMVMHQMKQSESARQPPSSRGVMVLGWDKHE